MKRLLLLATAVLAALVGNANALTFHYACKSGDDRYSLTVNTDRKIVKLLERGPPHTLTTFRILGTNDCGKRGWTLSRGATFCTATQGVGTLNTEFEQENNVFDCDNADTE